MSNVVKQASFGCFYCFSCILHIDFFYLLADFPNLSEWILIVIKTR